MTKDILAVTARLRARAGREEELKELLEQLVRDCAGHEGLLLYSVHQDRQDPASFVFYEQFVSGQALKAHLDTPELRRFHEKSAELLEGEAEVRLLNMLAKVGAE